MNLTVLVLACLSMFEMKRRSIESAVLNVFLPALLLIPSFYSFHLPHLPGLTCEGAALLPILVALILYRPRGFRIKREDLWVILFCAAASWSEYLATGPGDGIFDFFGYVEEAIFPYFFGRLMLEQPGFRLPFLKRTIILMAIASLASFPEFFVGKNIFYIIGRRLFTSTFIWDNQPRYGFVRTKGPYPGSINAGLVYLFGILLGAWVLYVQKKDPTFYERITLKLRKSTWIMVALVVGSLMTISRGPWIGTILGLIIANVGRAKHMGRALVITVIVCGIGGIAAKQYADTYTSASGDLSETQQSAVYRKEAFKLYEPIAQKGGFFGWGISSFPRVKGLDSIDNEYLLIRVSQGKIGYWLFLLMFAEAGLSVALAVRRTPYRSDMYLALCLGGLLAGLMVAISTVYVTGQTMVMLFMMFGWVQSLKQNPQPYEAVDQVPAKYEFRRVFA